MSVTALYESLNNDATAAEAQTMLCGLARNTSLTVAKRAAIIAILWASRRRATLRQLLERAEFREIAALSRAAVLLDTPRKIRQLERQLQRVGPKRQGALRAKVNDLQAMEVPASFSLTRCFSKLLRQLLGGIPSEKLEFDALYFDDAPWRPVIDLSHTRPDGFALEYFQPMIVAGVAPPEGSLLADARAISVDNLPEMLDRHPRLHACYSFIRTALPPSTLDVRCKAALASAAPLADLLWHYEEVACPAADARITERLEGGETLTGALGTDNFAKLLDRLLTFRKRRVAFWPLLMPYADELLERPRAAGSSSCARGRARCRA